MSQVCLGKKLDQISRSDQRPEKKEFLKWLNILKTNLAAIVSTLIKMIKLCSDGK